MARRAFLFGPRFAFRKTDGACEACVFGSGHHATFCPRRNDPLNLLPGGALPMCGREVCTGRVVTDHAKGAPMYCTCPLGRDLKRAENPHPQYV